MLVSFSVMLMTLAALERSRLCLVLQFIVEMILEVKVSPDWSELNINRVNISQEVVKYIVEICASQEYNIKWMCLPQNSIYDY